MEKPYNNICYGCSACANICPKSAIEMHEDSKGFLYPEILGNCIDCGLCARVCSSDISFKNIEKTYIATLKNKDDLMKSQSGGAFYAISEVILNMCGIVYGTVLDDKLEAVHVRAINSDERDKMRGSKYIQSRIENVYSLVKDDLKNNKTVLFSGTPCQVDGLYKFLKNLNVSINNLFTADLICHGVPSVLLWRDLIKYYETKYNHKITKAVFRDKREYGWESHVTLFEIGGKKINDEYHRQLFYNNLNLRESCYKCEYAKKYRVGDFTIADAWGVKEKNPEFYNADGVSLIHFNSQKALNLFNDISEYMNLKNVRTEDYIQGNMISPSKPNRNFAEFWKDYNSRSFEYIISKYAKNNVFYNWKYVLGKIRRKILGK